jgi:hypothetical protein
MMDGSPEAAWVVVSRLRRLIAGRCLASAKRRRPPGAGSPWLVVGVWPGEAFGRAGTVDYLADCLQGAV